MAFCSHTQFQKTYMHKYVTGKIDLDFHEKTLVRFVLI